MDGADRETGQVAPLLALFAVAIGLACLGLGRFAAGAVDEARARTAADAAALAGALDGESGASTVARANDGVVEAFEAAGDDVRVRVRVGDHVASARATAPRRASDAGETSSVGLAPAVRAALARASQLLGRTVPVTSGFRTAEEQRRLWLGRAANPFPVAAPGSSMHERGLAVDVPSAVADELATIGPSVGLCRPYPKADPVHFELCDRRLPAEAPG